MATMITKPAAAVAAVFLVLVNLSIYTTDLGLGV
jgi:hypothetical protein